MPAKRARNIAFSESHYLLIDQLMERTGLSASELVRRFIDHGIQNNHDMLKDDLVRKRDEVDLKLKILEQLPAPSETPRFTVEGPSRALRHEDKAFKLARLTPAEIIENYIDAIDKETGTGRIARKHIRDVIRDHPDYIIYVPEDKRKYIQGGD